MSSWKSSPTGRRSSSGRRGERTPLRSLENDTQHLSTPSPRKSKPSLLHADAEMATKDVSFCDAESPLLSPLSITFTETGAITALGHGDVTFKSFICAGGEVEISESSVCAAESIVLQTVDDASETEDTVISDSVIVQSCSDHMEHPYCYPELKEASSVDINAECLNEIPEISRSTEHLDHNHLTQENITQSGDGNITWKSFACNGGEVEVSDVTRSQDETIPLLNGELLASLKDLSIDSSYAFDGDLVCQTEHADHPYYSNENVIVNSVTFSEAPDSCEKPADGLNDVTFKSFNCAGGEIELSEGIAVADETVPLQADQISIGSESLTHDIDPSIFVGDHDVLHDGDHLDHPYCNIENILQNGNRTAQEPCNHEALDEIVPNGQTWRQDDISPASVNCNQAEDELPEGLQVTETISPLLEQRAQAYQHMSKPSDVAQDHTQNIEEAAVEALPSSLTNTPLRTLDEESVHVNVKETPKNISIHHDANASPSVQQKTQPSDSSYVVASAAEVQQLPQHDSQVQSDSELDQPSETKDSALGSSGNGQIHCNSAEKAIVETLPDVLKLLSETPSIAPALHFGILSPVIKRVSQSLKARRDAAKDQFLADDSVLDGERSFVAPVNVGHAGLWTEHLESPMPRPLFNSTVLGCKPQSRILEQAECLSKQPFAEPQAEAKRPGLDIPLIADGPLQQQLRQMAEFLMLASGKMGLAGVTAPVPPPAPLAPTTARAIPVKTHSVCVATTPVKMVDHSLNTSGHFERKRDFSVTDACTLTDPLLWNVPPGSLECLPRQELELRLRSSMIMVEALVQQLSVARAHGRSSMGPPPSELREKLVQTDHTELSQTTMYRDLYMAALKKIGDLELDEGSLQNLSGCMQDMQVTMTSLCSETGAALCDMKKLENFVRDDHQSLVSHYAEMKSLFEKSNETQTRMMQRVKDALKQRDHMKLQMEEALTAKEAAFGAMEQLRTHSATEISELQKSVGSQQELLSAVNTTYTEQVALNQANSDVLNSASELLAQTMEEQSFLINELCTVRSLLHKSAPLLLQLNEKAASALRERDEHISARDQALEERDQMEEELNQATLSLQTAGEQIGDLNLQVTILTSEMGVLRQKLTEREEERAQLERKVTEMSATVSSTMASHTFLEHALAAEMAKLVESQKEMSQVNERADELEETLCQSEQRVYELGQALAEREEHLGKLQELSQSQSVQIQELQDVCTQLNGVREMNEFLQMENELARDQVVESEQMLRANLQGLRERNIQCEDLKGELGQLQLEHRSLQEQLVTQKAEAIATQLELREKLAQAVTEITLLHHTLRGATNALHAALNEEKSEAKNDTESQPVHNTERRHPSSSFVDSIMVALTSDKEGDVQMETPAGPVPSDLADSQTEALFSQTSAFTRIAVVTPKKMLSPQDFEPEEEQTCVAELLADLGSTVTELVTTLKSLQQRKDAELEELRNTIFGLKVEQEATNGRHEAEVLELKQLINRLNSLVEKGNQALQLKAQDEKMITSLMEELNEAQELVTKQKTDNNELRKELSEIRRSLQQSQVESQFLRKELKNPGGQSANPEHLMEEKIHLLKEVERLKLNLQEVEQARVKLLERAKRHQIIHQTNQQKSENELQMLNNMINKVRETLLCLPAVVKNCEQLQQLVEYIG